VHEWDITRFTQLARVTSGHDTLDSFVEYDTAIDSSEDARQLMCDDDDGNSSVSAQAFDHVIELDGHDRIETGGRLVEKQELRLEHQGSGDAGALLHATRDLPR
jgi:hypothetical protein